MPSTNGVDENGYLQPQPSDSYIASHKASSSSSFSPHTTTTVAETPSPTSVQRHQTQDDHSYQSLQPQNDVIRDQLYQPLRKEMI